MEAGSHRLEVRPGGIPWPAGRKTKELVMKWETPQAVDQRFGFEITMYIANR
jgi:coenzyme PQQ precursor peptide PqqA